MKSVVLFQRDRENKFTRKVGSTWLMFSLTTCFISGMIIEGSQDVNAATGQSVSVDNSSLGQTLESGVNGTASWNFDSETGTLTFGAGQLSEPIYRMSGITSDSITKIVFSNGTSFPYDSNSLMANLHNLTSISGLNQVDISNTRVMWAMFLGDSKLTDLSGVESWDMSKIVDIGGFFQGTGIQNIDLSKWNTSNITSMWGTFAHTNVRTLTSIQNWDVSKVQVMDHMFDGTADLLNIDLSNWKIQSVHVMNDLFADSGVKQIDGLNNWNVSTVTNANELFLNTYNLSSLDIHSWNLDNATTNGLFTNIGNGDTFILDVGANRFSNSFNDMGPYVLQAVDSSIGGTIADPKGQYFSGTSLQKRYDDGFNSEEVYVFSNIVAFKAAAISSLKSEAQKIKQSIVNDNTLSDSDKNNQEKAVDDALSKATASVNAATDANGINQAKSAGIVDIDSQYKEGVSLVDQKAAAISSLKSEAQKIKQSIVNDNTLSDSDKNNQEKAVDDALSKATASVNAATDANGINQAKSAGIVDIDSQYKEGVSLVDQKAAAISSLKSEAQKIKQSIVNDNTLSDSDKNNQEKAVDDALSKATASVNAATDANGINQAKSAGIVDIDSQYKENIFPKTNEFTTMNGVNAQLESVKSLNDIKNHNQLPKAAQKYKKSSSFFVLFIAVCILILNFKIRKSNDRHSS